MCRNSTSRISKEDKKLLITYCDEIGKILEKYPYSNNNTEYMPTTMTNVKNALSKLKLNIQFLETEK